MSRLQPSFHPWLLIVPLGGLFLLSAKGIGEVLWKGGGHAKAAGFEERSRIEARRGDILDANGVVLATDRPVWELHMELEKFRGRTPEDLAVLAEQLDWFAEATGLERVIFERVEEAWPSEGARGAVLERGFTYAQAQRLKAALRTAPNCGMQLHRGWDRVYPQGRIFSHLLGFTRPAIDVASKEEQEKEDFDRAARIGVQGLEREFDDQLRGVDGEKRALLVGGDFGVNPALGMEEAVPGETVHTTLDARLGARMREELVALQGEWDPEWSVALVMDVKTGALLGAEGLPDFDCNNPGRTVSVRTLKDGTEVPVGLVFPAATNPPGSTVKPFIVAQALATGAIGEHQVFENFGGSLHVPGRGTPIGNAYMVPISDMTPEEAIIHSSNVVLAQIGLAMTNDAIPDLWEAAGYYQPIDLAVLGRQPSQLPEHAAYHAKNARAFAIPSATFGGEQAFTPLHHISAWQGLLNDGMRLKPRLLAADPVVELGHVVDPAAARTVRPWLEGVIDPQSRGLKNVRAHLKVREDLRWGGKSGSEDKNRDDAADLCLFVGFAPMDDPQVVVLVVVEEPGGAAGSRAGDRVSGSRVAGPVAGRILGHAMELRGLIAPLPNLDSTASPDTLLATESR